MLQLQNLCWSFLNGPPLSRNPWAMTSLEVFLSKIIDVVQ